MLPKAANITGEFTTLLIFAGSRGQTFRLFLVGSFWLGPFFFFGRAMQKHFLNAPACPIGIFSADARFERVLLGVDPGTGLLSTNLEHGFFNRKPSIIVT